MFTKGLRMTRSCKTNHEPTLMSGVLVNYDHQKYKNVLITWQWHDMYPLVKHLKYLFLG